MAAISTITTHESGVDIPCNDSRIRIADATRDFTVLYCTIQHCMQMHPGLTFQKIEHYLRQGNGFFYLVALPQAHSTTCMLSLCGPEDTAFSTQHLGQTAGYQLNFARLNQCHLPALSLSDTAGPALLPAKHLGDDLLRMGSYFARVSQEQQPSFADHWESLSPEQVRSEPLRFQGATRNAYASILERYPPSDNMFEIGSGYYPIVETLPSLTGKVVLSDFRERYIAYLTEQFPASQSRHFDLFQPLVPSLRGAFDTVFMTDVMITLSRQELEQSASTLFDLLPPEGKLLHFSVRDTSQSPVYKELVDQGYLCCPWITHDERLIGVYAIKKEEFIAAVENLGEPHSQVKQALQTYISWPEQYRELYCFYALCEEHGDGCRTNTRKLVASFDVLANAFQMLNCPSLRQVQFDAFHAQMIHEALEKTGFVTLESSCTVGKYTGEKSKRIHGPSYNTFAINRGDYRASFNPEIPEGKATQIAHVYLLAVQKPK